MSPAFSALSRHYQKEQQHLQPFPPVLVMASGVKDGGNDHRAAGICHLVNDPVGKAFGITPVNVFAGMPAAVEQRVLRQGIENATSPMNSSPSPSRRVSYHAAASMISSPASGRITTRHPISADATGFSSLPGKPMSRGWRDEPPAGLPPRLRPQRKAARRPVRARAAPQAASVRKSARQVHPVPPQSSWNDTTDARGSFNLAFHADGTGTILEGFAPSKPVLLQSRSGDRLPRAARRAREARQQNEGHEEVGAWPKGERTSRPLVQSRQTGTSTLLFLMEYWKKSG